MTIPERIELAIERHWNVAYAQGYNRLETDDIEGSAQIAEQELREAIATALLAAEQRGMERAAEMSQQIIRDDREEAKRLASEGVYDAANYWNARADGTEELATAIRKARELLK